MITVDVPDNGHLPKMTCCQIIYKFLKKLRKKFFRPTHLKKISYWHPETFFLFCQPKKKFWKAKEKLFGKRFPILIFAATLAHFCCSFVTHTVARFCGYVDTLVAKLRCSNLLAKDGYLTRCTLLGFDFW